MGFRVHSEPGGAAVSYASPIHRRHLGVLFPEELYGDFEDLETGDVHKGKSDPDTQV